MAPRVMTLVALVFGMLCLCLPVYSARLFDGRNDLATVGPAIALGFTVPLQAGQLCDNGNDCHDSLSPPASNKSLALLALGRGTFNYSCEDAEPANAPAFVEQYTELYDATPFLPILVDEEVLSTHVQQLYDYDYGDVKNSSLECVGAIGTLDGTAVVTLYEIDTFEVNLVETLPSPDDPETNGLWAHSRSLENDWEMYRVEMVGGAVPSTCDGRTGTFDVQYAAEYWFYHG